MYSQCKKLMDVFLKNRGKPLTRLDLYKLTGIINIPGRVYDLRIMARYNIGDINSKCKVHIENDKVYVNGKHRPAYVFWTE